MHAQKPFRHLGLVLLALLSTVCGSRAKPAPWTAQNPNFDDGLSGWKTTGSVRIVAVNDLPGITRAAQLTLEGNTAPTLSQEVPIPTATHLEVSAFVTTAGGAMLNFSGFGEGVCGVGGDNPNSTRSGCTTGSAGVQPGTLNLIWTIPATDFAGKAIPDGATATITGVALEPNAFEPGPT